MPIFAKKKVATEVSLLGVAIRNEEMATSVYRYLSLSRLGERSRYARLSVRKGETGLVIFDGLNDMHQDMITLSRVNPGLIVARNQKELGSSLTWEKHTHLAAGALRLITGEEICYVRQVA